MNNKKTTPWYIIIHRIILLVTITILNFGLLMSAPIVALDLASKMTNAMWEFDYMNAVIDLITKHKTIAIIIAILYTAMVITFVVKQTLHMIEIIREP